MWERALYCCIKPRVSAKLNVFPRNKIELVFRNTLDCHLHFIEQIRFSYHKVL